MANHPRNPGYSPGDHWVVCDVCGFDYPQSQIKMRWDGYAVCEADWESRHPQDFLRGVTDDSSAKGIVRSEPENIFIKIMCTNRSAISGLAVAGCAIAGRPGQFIPIPTPTFLP